MPRALIIALALATTACAQSPGLTGSITVKVLDQQNKPVRGATVTMDPPPGTMLMHASPMCKTDQSGVCTRSNLSIETYFLHAKKREDGYPDMRFSFYGHQTKPIEVHLTPGSPDANIVFVLGPPAAIVKLEITDDATGTPVDNPSIILRNPLYPSDMVSIGKTADSTVLIPPDNDVEIEIRADGYEPWQSREHRESTSGKPLLLHQGESTRLSVHLRHR